MFKKLCPASLARYSEASLDSLSSGSVSRTEAYSPNVSGYSPLSTVSSVGTTPSTLTGTAAAMALDQTLWTFSTYSAGQINVIPISSPVYSPSPMASWGEVM